MALTTQGVALGDGPVRVIRCAVEATTITDPDISNLIHRRIETIADDVPYDAKLHGYFVVLEAGDTVEAINDRVGFDVLDKPVEILEDCGTSWSMLFIISDDGFGVEVFVPKTVGKTDAIDPRPLAMLEAFSNKQGTYDPTP